MVEFTKGTWYAIKLEYGLSFADRWSDEKGKPSVRKFVEGFHNRFRGIVG